MSTTKIFKPWLESPDLSTSMADFESKAYSPSLSRTPSTRHGSHLQSPTASTYSDVTDDALQESWSPPAWRKAGSGWFRHQGGLASPLHSRAASPELERRDPLLATGARLGYEEDDDDEITAADIPLPGSPVKGRSISRSLSPQQLLAPPVKDRSDQSSPVRHPSLPPQKANSDSQNYIRFSMRADVQHQTAPLEAVVSLIRQSWLQVFKSKHRTFMSLMTCILVSSLFTIMFTDQPQPPSPDLVRVAGMAKTFEPLMQYSDNGHVQIVQLGDAGVAVWDLGESVRSTNMTSGPIIVRELDELSESLKSLSLELTRFFASIDGDIDSILIVMEWAQRELAKVSSLPESRVSTVFANLHVALSRIGVLENPHTGLQTGAGKFVQDLFGPTNSQRTRDTLQRTFMEFLGVLEEGINNELKASHSLFAHFEAIDRQFLNLQRLVIRETDAQEREESEVLASLWSRIMGANAARLKKFEKNKSLLLSLRGRTVQNKHVLVDHNGRLLQLRSNLEMLRKKLVSPLVRSNQSSTLSVEEQLKGLEGTYTSLRLKREQQKTRKFEAISEGSAAGSRNWMIGRGEDMAEIGS